MDVIKKYSYIYIEDVLNVDREKFITLLFHFLIHLSNSRFCNTNWIPADQVCDRGTYQFTVNFIDELSFSFSLVESSPHNLFINFTKTSDVII